MSKYAHDMTPKEEYQQNGFLIVRNLLTPEECTEMKREIQRILQEKKDYGGVLVGLAATSAVFQAAAHHPKLLDAIESVIGSDILFLSDKVVFKSSDVRFASPWHQDWHYWKGAHKLSVWIALDPTSTENGCLKMLPGSHKSIAVHDGSAPEGEGFGHRLNPDAVDENEAFIAECNVGDAVLFHDLTLHASFPNISGEDRIALISTYRNAAEPDFAYDWAVAAMLVRGKATDEVLTAS